MKKLICVLLIVALAACGAFALTACNKGNGQTDAEYIEGKGTLICGITLYEPMNYPDPESGDLVGFDTEFANAVAEKLGMSAKFQIINWDDKIIELNAKSIDCIWNGFTVNDERKGQVEFTQSYLNNTQCVVVKTANLASYTSVESLADKKAVAEAGSAGETAAKGLTDEANVTSVTAQSNALLEVKAGNNVDFAVIDLIMANSMVGKGDYADLSIVTAIQLEAEEYAVGFRKGSDMVAKVNAAINELIADGTLLALAQKYGVDNALITE